MKHNIGEFLFGRAPESSLPERVSDAITRQQRDSEQLIGWVQLLLVTIFGTLYAVAPKTAMSDGFHPVPWALALYFLFTFTRLALSYRILLPAPVLTLSVVADISLLMVLIWSFHIQYMQPASFYLKAPTMMYVFIFIALRTLRFDPRYILLAGATAAIGWLVLVLYVLWSEGGHSMITRNYVTYLTSNSILIGAEIDKIISIVMVSGVLAIAVLRAQRSFKRAVSEEIAAQDLSRFVSREVADRITHSEHQIRPGDGEAVNATVMFTDIEGFSTVSETLSPTELAHMLNDYFGATSAVIEKFGGVITQFQGDAMLITFNAVKPDADHGQNAINTALEIQRLCETTTFCHGGKLKTRCGINTGDIIVGAIGSENRLTFTVHGDTVNIAARLEPLNKQFGTYILATEATLAHCGNNASSNTRWSQRGDVTVRGRSQPTPIFSTDYREYGDVFAPNLSGVTTS
ncbi:adenylate/guanylate cyclase domain-containing protein [Thalassospira sp. MCCC 1A01428]|uniref:adenylate/guanylate cyclase domain-containing protein n=1 Tax=Thalassospira sp. MCCC 1A01428 TaxID=1470575 RepID=UPI000A1E7456|nr:adenylate/guanylate cyclase domain-containing protein [Thalassospira sp. MCCC 1A01428]